MTLPMVGNTMLRTAITKNLVSFPSQVQSFMKRDTGDVRERVVQLYFVRGWKLRRICDRYGLSKAMAHKLLTEWRIRAIESGHIQEIEPDALERLTREAEANGGGGNYAVTDSAAAMAAAIETRAPLQSEGTPNGM